MPKSKISTRASTFANNSLMVLLFGVVLGAVVTRGVMVYAQAGNSGSQGNPVVGRFLSSDFSGKSFIEGDRSAPNWTFRNFAGVNFSNSNLTKAELSYSDLSNANFTGAELSRAGLRSVMVKGAVFAGATLMFADLTGTDFSSVDFSNANLSMAGISRNVRFTGANFTNANLNQASGHPVDTSGAVWNNTICPDGTNSNAHADTCDGHFLN